MKRRKNISIPVIAMADIAFLLLIFLMVSSMSSPKKSMHLQLPKIVNVEKVKLKNSYDIFATKEGKYFFDNKELKLNNLKEEISNIPDINQRTIFFIHGDENTPYHFVDDIINVLQSNKIYNCVFVTKKTEANNK